MNAKKWVISFMSVGIAIMLVMMGVVYIYDPYCYYRIPDNRFIVNNYRFVNAGIAKNADYDAVVIGSSMTQNFQMDDFREQLGVNPIKLTVGAMSIEGMELTYNLVKDVGKAEKIYLCIDVPQLNKEKDDLATYATYLYNETKLDDFKYLLGYETWARLLPLSIAFNVANTLEMDIPRFYGTTDIDRIGEWESKDIYDESKLIESYLNRNTGLSKQNTAGAYNRMVKNVDKIIDLTCNDGKEIVLFFPPYSALFWCSSMESGLFEDYMRIKSYILDKVVGMKNVSVYDFQAIPQICDLRYYKDITHYNAKINAYMVDCFANNEYFVTSETIEYSNDALRERIKGFKSENSDWLK